MMKYGQTFRNSKKYNYQYNGSITLVPKVTSREDINVKFFY